MQGPCPPLNRQERRSNLQMSHLQAIAQVSDIMDLLLDDVSDLSHKVASQSLEGVIRKVYEEGRSDDSVLDKLETLVWKFSDSSAVPSYLSLQTLWLLYQRRPRADLVCLDPDLNVARRVRLLTVWSNLSVTSDLFPPPKKYFIDTFDFVRQENATMTSSLWRLYQQHCECNPSRQFFEAVLDALDSSPSEEWKIRQCKVLEDMYRLGKSRLQPELSPTTDELESALWVASRLGQAQQASWLYRILSTEQNRPSIVREAYLRAWFLSLCNCKAKGSVRYLERLLERTRHQDPSSPINSREYYNMVLARLSASRQPGSGMRAEKLYQRMMNAYDETSEKQFHPSEESKYFVFQAYQNEEPKNPQNDIDAQRFMQQAKQQIHT